MFFTRLREKDLFHGATLYTHTHTCNQILNMIHVVHGWQLDICAKAIDTSTKCFSHFLFSNSAKGPSVRNVKLSEGDTINWRQKTSKAFPALCGWAQLFSPPAFFLFQDIICFFGVQSLATKSHVCQLPLTEYVFIRNGPLSSKTLVWEGLKRKWTASETVRLWSYGSSDRVACVHEYN